MTCCQIPLHSSTSTLSLIDSAVHQHVIRKDKKRMSQSHPIPATKSPEPPEASASGSGPSPLQTLHCLLHSIALPKTQKAKTCSIALEMLLEVRKLISIACTTFQHPTHSPNPSPGPTLNTIIQKLDRISTHIKPKQPATQTYASILASKAMSPMSPTAPSSQAFASS